MNDTRAGKLAHRDSSQSWHTRFVFLKTGDGSRVPRMFTH